MTNEDVVKAIRQERRELINDAVSGLFLDEMDERFLAYIIEFQDMDFILKFCNIIQKAKEYKR